MSVCISISFVKIPYPIGDHQRNKRNGNTPCRNRLFRSTKRAEERIALAQHVDHNPNRSSCHQQQHGQSEGIHQHGLPNVTVHQRINCACGATRRARHARGGFDPAQLHIQCSRLPQVKSEPSPACRTDCEHERIESVARGNHQYKNCCSACMFFSRVAP